MLLNKGGGFLSRQNRRFSLTSSVYANYKRRSCWRTAWLPNDDQDQALSRVRWYFMKEITNRDLLIELTHILWTNRSCLPIVLFAASIYSRNDLKDFKMFVSQFAMLVFFFRMAKMWFRKGESLVIILCKFQCSIIDACPRAAFLSSFFFCRHYNCTIASHCIIMESDGNIFNIPLYWLG